jgi:hypothetical protein
MNFDTAVEGAFGHRVFGVIRRQGRGISSRPGLAPAGKQRDDVVSIHARPPRRVYFNKCQF